MAATRPSRFGGILWVGAVAGIAGGLAEIAWVTLYGALAGTPIEPVVRGVVATLMPALAGSSWSIPLGIVIHMSLAFALGLGLAVFVERYQRQAQAPRVEFALVTLVLAVVWAVNFLVVLPYFNPEFVRLLPHGVTLFSKLLFGLSAATVLWVDGKRGLRVHRM
jgi:hypothetical protein